MIKALLLFLLTTLHSQFAFGVQIGTSHTKYPGSAPTEIRITSSYTTISDPVDEMNFDRRLCNVACDYGFGTRSSGGQWSTTLTIHVTSAMKTWGDLSDAYASKYGSTRTLDSTHAASYAQKVDCVGVAISKTSEASSTNVVVPPGIVCGFVE